MSVPSRRGYLSFLLLIPLALLLLLPLLLRSPAPSTTALYATERTMNEQIAFKRALLVSAHQTILNLRTRVDITPVELVVAADAMGYVHPPLDTPPLSSFFDLTLDEQECLSRFEVLSNWASLSDDWRAHSDYDVNIQCQRPFFGDWIELGRIPAGASFGAWGACGSHLSWNSLTYHLAPQPGLQVLIRHKNLDINSTSPLPSMEVGG